ncbi:hypothetical protein PUNSTDRAFT_120008 [Punctularia strigosozonata HHB-11173 SS5]|uniref:uncharacterized protein n=1 Tax=Punctularia strigosozonata (strain HHB-11173) TaxID=741275 RepID=UPI0004416577|nr:uncharacterized protein PUNSTDRAFT_120008 [Punctularia strigosozonata HHB-11173 SS5]EIN09555.1 hypothetical protein PUNSTDRAFT_120008 [Punctularia strigosozonata HHB-11173 SS5]
MSSHSEPASASSTAEPSLIEALAALAPMNPGGTRSPRTVRRKTGSDDLRDLFAQSAADAEERRKDPPPLGCVPTRTPNA